MKKRTFRVIVLMGSQSRSGRLVRSVAFLISKDCPIKCRSCANSNLPNGEMHYSDAIRYVDLAAKVSTVKRLGFTGGEPFLWFEKMLQIGTYAWEKYGFEFSISTNAYWASTFSKSQKMLETLYEIGLRRMLISVDDFHQEFISLTNIKQCLLAAKKIGIQCVVQCICTHSSKNAEEYRKLLGFDDPNDPDVKWADNPCDPIGRAATAIPDDEFLLKPEIPSVDCSVKRTLLIFPDGTVKPCCGTGSIADFLTVGNVKKDHLVDIVKRMDCNPLINALTIWNGPHLLAKMLKELKAQEDLSGSYTSACHACYEMLSQQQTGLVLKDHLERRQIELLAARLLVEEQRETFSDQE